MRSARRGDDETREIFVDIRTFTAPDGLRLAYRDTGARPGDDRPPLVCRAGLTRAGADFDCPMPHHPGGLRVIRPDYRGRGASAHDPDPSNYSIPVEAGDVVALLDHLGLGRVAILGTSRGGLIAMALAAGHRARIAGVMLNDIGPEIAPEGLARIRNYVGLPQDARSIADLLERWEGLNPGFRDVPRSRWEEALRRQYRETADGLALSYDPALRGPVLAAGAEPPPIWPLFDALEGLPLGVIRGANSDLLSPATLAEMRRRRPDMIVAEVPDRAHVPFLDEPEALAAIAAFLERVA
ncbi:MAG: alpha/beta hydrolase [Rhodobacteraceae bacterium]|nr:alpha/beta hydrolase [Paracoccaceae bacterium]